MKLEQRIAELTSMCIIMMIVQINGHPTDDERIRPRIVDELNGVWGIWDRDEQIIRF